MTICQTCREDKSDQDFHGMECAECNLIEYEAWHIMAELTRAEKSHCRSFSDLHEYRDANELLPEGYSIVELNQIMDLVSERLNLS